ncbi:MAG: CDP-glycerol glycerophosphotransferase family protein [Nitrosarchaeum sp.]|nr:CDP-glycerol glycerophosphotransferase family protein [Nitrosarchaeum sp.]MCA9819721.1 CDP-glycerol glycerophosphotransferase family protein [Nitrosarchaeum sp.]
MSYEDKMSKLVLIFDDFDLESFMQEHYDDCEHIIAANEKIKDKVLSLGRDCITIGEFSGNPLETTKQSIQWIKTWPDSPVLNGKSFKELLVYNDISIYWFLETRLYLFRIQSLIQLVEQIKNIFSEKQYDSVIVKGSRDAYHVIKEKFKPDVELYGVEEKGSSVSQNSHGGHGYLKLNALKLIRGFSSLQSKTTHDRPALIITELANWREEFDYKKRLPEKKDVIFSSIIKQLSESSVPIRIIDFENKSERLFKSFSINKQRQKNFSAKVEPWEKYVTKDIMSKTKKYNHRLESLLSQLHESDEFRASLTYDGISIYEILKKDFDDLTHSFKTYVSPAFIDTAKRILEEIKPSVVVMHDEYGTLQLCIIKAASKQNIPTIAVQHGVNTETWISYVHNPEHVNGNNPDLNFPLPDYLCVWSDKARSNLIKHGHFPPTVPVVTGDPKSDFLPDAIKSFDSDKIMSKARIPPNKKIILFAGQTLSNLEEKSIITNSLFQTISRMDDSFLVIKAHPNESDLSYYEKAAKQYGVKDFVILQSHNLYELIFVSNVIIVPYSTVGIEAMRLRKPVIAMNMMRLHDDDPLIASKIPIIVEKAGELLPAIKKCLQDNTTETLDKAELFAQNQIGMADGLSAQRITKLIIDTRNKTLH